MSETDQKSVVSAEGKSAAAEFLSTFKNFKQEMSKSIQDMGTRIEAIDRKGASIHRPALATQAEGEAPHAKAFAAYVRHGEEEGLRALSIEGKGLNTGTLNEGGYLVDPQTSDQINSVLRSGASIRALSNVVQVEAGTYDALVDHNDIDASWMAETGAVVETQAPLVDRVSIPLHELSATPAATQRLLDDSAFNIEEWLAGRISERFLRAESSAFVNGTGTNQPTGFLTKPTAAQSPSLAWGTLGYVATGTSGDFDPNDPADVLIDLVYALDAEYRSGAAFVMNSKTAGEIRKMKDSHGRFLWMEGLGAEQPPLIAGHPVLIVEAMPDIGVDSYSVAFGNFRRGYTIAERPDLRILRDPYSSKPNVLFYASKRVGGDVTDFAAIKLLKFGTS